MNALKARQDILEKVQKVMAMTNSPNPEEAETAMQMAKRLMEKYQIQMDELKLIKEKKENIVVKMFDSDAINPRLWSRLLAVKISKFYDCHVHRSDANFVFVGFELDAKIATQMMGYLYWGFYYAGCEHLESRQEDKGKGSSQKIINDFCIGATQSISNRIDKILRERNKVKTENCTALIVVKADAINKYIKRNYDLSSDPIRMGSDVDLLAYAIGREHGDAVVLNKPLEGGTK